MGKVIPLKAYKKLKWFFKTVGYPVYVYEEMEELFEVVESKELVCGLGIKCKKCGKLVDYVREDYCDLHKCWLVVHVICASCGNRWKVRGMKPMYMIMFEEWDLEEEIKWETHSL